MDSILLTQLFEAVKAERRLFSLANLRSLSADKEGLLDLQQKWGAAFKDVKDKGAALGIN